ncbi:MAG TPA: glucose-1-phosphate cytidylyltransferase [Blastocatellia bacterium]|nr:glucose-1-phosphate cytidylyltransferase [Blastocatellia bacterium]
MKTVILCGGRGTRLGEHGINIPKALIDIGGKPILWHLLKLYANAGLNDFILCLGYLGDAIKRYFLEQQWLANDFTLQMKASGEYELHNHRGTHENWRITFVDTGAETNTGGRIKRVQEFIGDDETFCATYGDGLANVDLQALLSFHQSHGKCATLTAVNPRSQFGVLQFNAENVITEFQEKPLLPDWINGGFFVFNRSVFDYLQDDSVLEREPFEQLAREGQIMAYRHHGFWKCLDTYKDHLEFNQLWDEGKAEWKLWSEP